MIDPVGSYGFEDDDLDENGMPKRNPVFCVAVGGVLDLDEPDLGYPGLPNLWERLLADRRRVPERGLYCPICIVVRPAQPEWMYVYERSDGLRIAVHHNPNHKAHEGEGPEHKEFKDRMCRAAEVGGFRAEQEVRTADGKVQTDVQVTGEGGVIYGFEPQLSYRTAEHIQRRDKLRRSSGISPVWHVVDRKAPLIDHVNWARTDLLPAEAIRNNRDLLVRGGVRRLELEKCDERNPMPCPVKRTGRCGLSHPRWDPVGHQLDDLVRDIAGGQLVAVAFRQGSGTRRFWTPAVDRERYLDSGGVLAEAAGSERTPRELSTYAPGRRQVECTRDRVDAFIPTAIPPRDAGDTLRPPVALEADLRCGGHVGVGAMIAEFPSGLAELVGLRVAFLRAEDAHKKVLSELPSGTAIAKGGAEITDEQRARCDGADRRRMDIVLAIHRHPWWKAQNSRALAELEVWRLADLAFGESG